MAKKRTEQEKEALIDLERSFPKLVPGAGERTVQEKEVLSILKIERRKVVEQVLSFEKQLKANKDWAISPDQMEILKEATKKYTALIHRIHLR